MNRFRTYLLATSALIPLGLLPAAANPLGAQVVGGSATVQGQGTSTVTVTQQSNSAIVNWNTFNIGAGEKTNIVMPSSSSVQLDRVIGGLGPSQILGSLWSNGRVFLVNPDGILFGAGATVNTGGFLATTHDIANADFMAGKYNFSMPGNPTASIVNLGTITASNTGFAALVAPGVRNSGTITARLGTVGMASSGAGFSLDFYGDKLITLNVNNSIAATVKDVATGQTLNSLVSNDGKLKANGGRVELTAAAARQVVDSVIANSGVIEANTVGTHKGMIVLGAATASTLPAGAPTQTVKVSGTVSAAGKRKGKKGGTIQVTGQNIVLAGATLNASGRNGGGTVLVGGDTGGGKPSALAAAIPGAQLQPYAVPTASTVSVDAETTINASATVTGNGGKVVVWSDQVTAFLGTILARGGAVSGNGGFVETSGHLIDFAGGRVDTSAPIGRSGSWLLDPYDLTIDSGAAATIATSLATTNVTIETTASGSNGPGIPNSSGNGDIFVASSILWGSANSLTLSAYRNVAVNSNITNTGAAAINLHADNTGTSVGTVSFGNAAQVSSSGLVSIFYNPSVNPAGSFVNTTSYVNPTENFTGNVTGGGTLTAYMLVNSIYDLQNIQNNLFGTYALGKDIEASATANWNGGTGFVPIGNIATNFFGTFNGQGNTITNLVINLPTTTVAGDYTGLFGYVGTNGGIKNVGLDSVAVSGGNRVGGLVGYNGGTVSNSYTTGAVSGSFNVGGLVGYNVGTVSKSYTTGTASGSQIVGGLVGYNYNGLISQSYATGAVSGSQAVGGLLGYNGTGTVSQSYATGAVSGSQAVGGLLGGNSGIVSQSYATGAVSVGSGSYYVGGLVGFNDSGSTISESYATGAVSVGSGSFSVGGLVGYNSGNVSSSYWDTFTTGITGSAGGAPISSDPASANASNYAYKQSAYQGFDFTNNWFMIDGQTRPFLRSEYSTTITNAHQLQLISMDLGASYTLAHNIDLGPALAADANGNYPGMWGAAGFIPIAGSNSVPAPLLPTPFTGLLDGIGHVVEHLTIDSSERYIGLFGRIGATGIVRNVGLTDVLINKIAQGIVTSSEPEPVVGALAGRNEGTILHSFATGVMNIGGAFAGGLVGYNALAGSIQSSFANVSIAGTGTLGGLVGGNGTITGPAGRAIISQSYALGPVTGGNTSEVGGLVGQIFGAGEITQSYSTGRVQVGTNGTLGGLVGFYFSGTINSSYWDMETSGTSFSPGGGTGLATSVFKSGLPTGFDPLVWGISANVNSGYPYLQWQVPNLPTPPTPAPTPQPAPPSTPNSSPVGDGSNQEACAVCAVQNLGQFFTPLANWFGGLFGQAPNFQTIAGANVYASPTSPLPNFQQINGQNVYVQPYPATPTSPSQPQPINSNNGGSTTANSAPSNQQPSYVTSSDGQSYQLNSSGCPLQIACGFLSLDSHEGMVLNAYVPTSSDGSVRGVSGVTIGAGVDLGNGAVSDAQLESIFVDKNDPTLQFLQSVLSPTITGSAAKALLIKAGGIPNDTGSRVYLASIKLTTQQATSLESLAIANKVSWLVDRWARDAKQNVPKQFSALPPQAQTVLVDLLYPGLLYRLPPDAATQAKNPTLAAYQTISARFWNDLSAGLVSQAVTDLNSLAASKFATANGYSGRITDDANLLQQVGPSFSSGPT